MNTTDATKPEGAAHPSDAAAIPEDLHCLAADIHALLQTLDHGHAGAFLAQWPSEGAGYRRLSATALPVLRWFPAPETVAPGPRQRIVARLHQMRGQLTWRQTYGAEDFGTRFLDRYGWSELIGPRGPIASETLACGILLLGPDVEYPDHHHRAEELYLVLSGTASWRCAINPWCEQPPGAAIHHPPDVSHAMRTSHEPLLALYLWRGDGLTQKTVIG